MVAIKQPSELKSHCGSLEPFFVGRLNDRPSLCYIVVYVVARAIAGKLIRWDASGHPFINRSQRWE